MKRLLLALLLAPLIAFAQTNHYNILDQSSGNYNPASVAITGGTITGTPISGSTGSFTTLSASSTVSGTGFTNYFASPPCIGCTAPAAGAFTTLSATGTSTLAGVTATSLTNSGLTAKSFVYSGVGGLMSSTAAPTNGQLLIGSTGNAPVAATLTGTANQITFTNGAGSITASIPNTFSIPGTVSSVNGFSTAGNGVPVLVAKYDATAQQANISTSTVTYSVPSTGTGIYRIYVYSVVTQAATTSSTAPNVECFFTDNDTNVTETMFLGNTSTANTVGTYTQSGGTMYPKPSTNITCGTSGYGSSGATPMQFSLHIRMTYAN
jgi:hypothetical protein